MATCLLNRNILKSDVCGYSLNKVIDIYLANYSDVEVMVSGNSVTGFSTGTTFYHLEPSKDSASFSDELQVTDSGAKYRTHTLNFSIDSGNYDTALADNIDQLSLGRFVGVAKLASNGGKYVLLGRVAPLEATVVNNSGAASASEASAIEVTLVSDCTEVALPLTDAAVSALLASVPTSNS